MVSHQTFWIGFRWRALLSNLLKHHLLPHWIFSWLLGHEPAILGSNSSYLTPDLHLQVESWFSKQWSIMTSIDNITSTNPTSDTTSRDDTSSYTNSPPSCTTTRNYTTDSIELRGTQVVELLRSVIHFTLGGRCTRNGQEKVTFDSLASSCQVLGLYFSAHWVRKTLRPSTLFWVGSPKKSQMII